MESAFRVITTELERRQLANNRYRLSSGIGRSQTFGVVNRRYGLPNDYSGACFKRPYLYKLLLDFGRDFITTPFNAITINQSYQCKPHRDRNNHGVSTLVAFGEFSGGMLRIHDDGDLKGDHCVKNRLFVCDFSLLTHSVTPFTGTRYSLVYHQAPTTNSLPPPSVVLIGKKWRFYRGEELIMNGLPDDPRRKGFKYTSPSGLSHPQASSVSRSNRVKGGKYTIRDRVCIWSGTHLHCEHNRRTNQCHECRERKSICLAHGPTQDTDVE